MDFQGTKVVKMSQEGRLIFLQIGEPPHWKNVEICISAEDSHL
jgi:hypothetical protein